ncbi:hypothetical protein [Nostoc sp.]
MNRISKFLDITLWVLVSLGIIGGGFSAYVASSFLAGGNGGEATVHPDRLDRDASDRNSNQLSLDGERTTEARNSKQGIR